MSTINLQQNPDSKGSKENCPVQGQKLDLLILMVPSSSP